MNRSTIDALATIACEAGAVVMRYFGLCDPEMKSDGSPVTVADREAEATILDRIRDVVPGLPIVSEEAASLGTIPAVGNRFLLVDALDGTKEFLARSGQFTVNIAMVEDGLPVAGVVYAPAIGELWLAAGGIAEAMTIAPGLPVQEARNRRRIHARTAPAGTLIAVASLRHSSPRTEAFLARLPPHQTIAAGSSVKFCRLAEGAADIYPRFTPTMEWDTAAGDAVLRAAGGLVLTPEGASFRYGKRSTNFANGSFVAAGDPVFLTSLLQAGGA